jgi:hypothetical protein
MKCKALCVQTIYGGAAAIASDRSILELGTCPSGKSNKSGRFGDAMTTLFFVLSADHAGAMWRAIVFSGTFSGALIGPRSGAGTGRGV